MEDDTIVFLACAGEEARNVDERYQRDVERVAETYKACSLARSVAVEHTGKEFGLVGNDADRLAVETGETDDDILGKITLDFQELAIVDDCSDHIVHIVGTCGAVRHDFVERILNTVDGVVAFNHGRILKIVLGDVAHKLAHNLDCILAIFGREMSHTALLRMNGGTTEVFLAYIFAGNGLHNLRAGEEHVAYAFGHNGEVGQGRGIDGTAGTRAEDCGNLGDYTRCEDVALENLGITCQGVYTFLDTCTPRVVKTDDRRAHLHGHIHDFAYLECHGFGKRAAEFGEILGEHINQTAVDCAVAGYNAVAKVGFLFHAEVVATVGHEHIDFLKRPFVEQLGDTLTGCVLATFVLFFDGLFATTDAGFLTQCDKLLYFFELIAHLENNCCFVTDLTGW